MVELLPSLVWACAAGNALTLFMRFRGHRPAGSPQMAAVGLVAAGLAIGLKHSAFGWLTVGLFAVGVWLPGRLMVSAFRAMQVGEYGRAARRIGWVQRLRPLPQHRGLAEAWGALHAHYFLNNSEPLNALTQRLRASTEADAGPLLAMLAAHTRDWQVALQMGPTDLHARALCELGLVDGGIENFARLWPRKMGWNALRSARPLAVPPLAFGGRVAATAAALRAARSPKAVAAIWLGTAELAAGESTGKARIEAVLADPPNPVIAAAAAARLAEPPGPPRLGASALDVLDDLAREAHAADLVRARSALSSHLSLALVASMWLMFGLEATQGGIEHLPTLRALGGLLVGVDGPDWRLLSYAWLHYGWLHLGTNVIMLLLLAPMVEAMLGRLGLAVTWLASVLGGGLSILYLGSEGLTVGASGGAMGLLGAVVVAVALHPDCRGTRTSRVGLRVVVLALLFQVVADLSLAQVSAAGHLGGLLTGAAVGVVWLRLAPKGPREDRR
jgi:rhomboid protease GluP